MKSGTISILFGCHSIIHSIYVIKSWIKQNKKIPEPWELICIFLHDIGHVGTNYLDNLKEKEDHWKLGASIAGLLFGLKGWELIAGHCVYSGVKRNKLYYADKLAMYLVPRWWMLWCGKVEPKLHVLEISKGMTLGQAVDSWRERVRINIESGKYNGNHELYLEKNKEITGD